MKRLLALIATIGALVALSVPAASLAWDTDPRLNDTASWLAQRPVTVRCYTEVETMMDFEMSYLGVVAFVPIMDNGKPDNFMVIAHPWCNILKGALDKKAWAVPSWKVIASIFILVHESGHLRYGEFPLWFDEKRVNCWALRRTAAVAVHRFGRSVVSIPWINKIAVNIYRYHQPQEYWQPGCLKTLIP